MFLYHLEKDVRVLYKDVPTFPLGIKEAFDELYGRFRGRNFYGISHMDKSGRVIYKAAVETFGTQEPEQYGYRSFIIPKGDWLAEKVTGWMSKTDQLKEHFGQLMKDPRFDPSVDCVEWYKDEKEMLVMVKCR